MSFIRNCPECHTPFDIRNKIIDDVFKCPSCEAALVIREKSVNKTDTGLPVTNEIPEADPKNFL